MAGWIEGFRVGNPEMKHRLYNRDSASRFIGKHIGERQRRAFDQIAVPAMQSDYFRACALLAKGGAYVDADSVSGQPLRTLFSRAPYALMMTWSDHFQTGLMMFRARHDPLIAAWLEHITCNVERRVETNISLLTGPASLKLTIDGLTERSPALASVAKITPVPWSEAVDWIGFPTPVYKSGPRHWHNWRGSRYCAVPAVETSVSTPLSMSGS